MDFTALIKTIAPWIGGALGGPLGSLAVTAAADALGLTDKTTEALQQAIGGATPEQLLELKLADQKFQADMQALGFKQVTDLESIAAGDRESARKMQTEVKSRMPAAITTGVLFAFVGSLAAMFFLPIPDANRDMVIYMVGQLSGFTGAAIAFWLGTTRSSENKTQMIVETAQAATK